MEAFLSKGTIVAGVSYDIPGMGYENPQTGEIRGFEADLACAIAEKVLGTRDGLIFQQVTDAQRIPALQDQRVDIVLSQLTITADRLELVDFSIPYCVTREAILVTRESRIRAFDDLAHARIAVTAGSVSIRRMRAAFPDAIFVVTPLSAGNLEAVARGEADVASNDLINLQMLRAHSDQPDRYEIIDIGDRFEEKPFGVAIRKGNRTLLDLVNRAVQDLIENGDRDRILNAYLQRAGSTIGNP
ncbi:MAG: transporter substrate-binding domain-containing protein [Defluviicoccus sp.]|nr:MAG: transporter substrate-binding domain-containing protein [Defluviicoccus sp.]